MTHAQHILDFLEIFPDQRDPLDGVDVIRMGDLARQHGATRWKRAPAATGDNVHLVMLSLTANGIGLYAHDGNAADHRDGNLMAKSVLEQIHANDFVVTLDLTCTTAHEVADGSHPLTFDPVSDELLAEFRGDRIRAAVRNDVDRICHQVIWPRLFGTAAR